jgi:hypothetical protein
MDQSFASRVFLLLLRRLHLVVAAAVLTAVAVGIAVALQPRAYVATVDVVPKRARTEVDYETRIRTLTDSASRSGPNGASTLIAMTAERRQTLAQLVTGRDIERAVQQELSSTLPPHLLEPGRLLRLVQARAVPRNEVISIKVEAPSASLAEQIALSWARTYERQINALFVDSADGEARLESGLGQARQKYAAAEAALTAFVATSPVEEYSRLLDRKSYQLLDLQADRQAQLVDMYKVARRLDLLIDQAQALQQQLALSQDNNAAANTQLALTLLKTQVFASTMSLSSGSVEPTQSQARSEPSTAPSDTRNPQRQDSTTEQQMANASATRALQDWALPTGLQLQLPATTTTASLSQQRVDVAALVQALQEWRTRLQVQISHRLRESDSDGGQPAGNTMLVISALEAEVRELQGKVAEQRAQRRSLQAERDIAWESYASLSRKVEEMRVARMVTPGNEVAVVSESVVASPVSRRLAVVLPIAGLLGALAASCLILSIQLIFPMYRRVTSRMDDGGISSGAMATYPEHSAAG